jgi:stage V sporulation protein SpoVS
MAERPVVRLKVAGKTNVGKLAGSITKNLAEGKDVEAVAIGASAINQACKAIATSRGFLGSTNRTLRSDICFLTTPVLGDDGLEDRTAILFLIRYDE